MKKCITRLVLAAVILLALPASSTAAAPQEKVAATKSALSVSPAIIENVLTPGKASAFSLQVRNITDFPLPITTFVRNFTVQSEQLEQTDQARLNASKWFVLPEPDFILQPGQTRTVAGTIHPPADAEPGGHYATVFFQPLVPQEALSPSTAYVSARVGALAFLVVKGDITQSARLTSPLSTAYLAQSPVDFNFEIRNTGNTHIMPSGKIKVYDWQNAPVATLDVPKSIVLPDSTKKYAVPWNQAILGSYRAELSLGYGTDQLQLPKTTAAFWVAPWAGLAISVALAGGAAFFILKTKGRWRDAWHALQKKD